MLTNSLSMDVASNAHNVYLVPKEGIKRLDRTNSFPLNLTHTLPLKIREA